MDLNETSWNGLPGWQLESELLRVIVIPCLGAKLVSLFDKRHGREWLAQPLRPPPADIPYAASFLEYSLYGWDEMFPTINPCPYPDSSLFWGKSLPDHGEVWFLPWKILRAEVGELALNVEGISLPYRLSRSLNLSGPGTLEMHYQLANLSGQKLYYLWAAHPLFAGDESIRILLPGEVQQVLNVQESDIWGPPGTVHPWPKATGQDGQVRDLRRPSPLGRHDSRKFYLLPNSRVPWAGLTHDTSGSELRLAWDPDILPYLGIWVDEGRYSVETTIALEPVTGFYDGLDLAYNNQRASWLPPGMSNGWSLTVSLKEATL